ncbi:MAG: lipopolysaccharide core heptose(I) kinase RfaP [Desulfobacterales bacterium]|nr:lipopolysaccharide core heptose(I) kinase RfaP [Desulfobacterales bacterium]
MLVIPDAWLERWQGRDVFDQLFSIEGRVYREQEGRKTQRFSIDGRQYFAKLHAGVGWKEILKNLLQLRLPALGAQNEWQGIQRCNQLGINTAHLVGYGQRGWNPARIQSFVVTEELTNTMSLEDFCHKWQESPPGYELKKALITEVAKISRTIHENGLNHKDLYICHFLLDVSNGWDRVDPHRLRLYLIDLHRMQKRRRTPRRWRVKDIAALYYSSMDIGLTKRDLLRFIRVYRNKPLKITLKEDEAFWRRVRRRGNAFYREGVRKNLIRTS